MFNELDFRFITATSSWTRAGPSLDAFVDLTELVVASGVTMDQTLYVITIRTQWNVIPWNRARQRCLDGCTRDFGRPNER